VISNLRAILKIETEVTSCIAKFDENYKQALIKSGYLIFEEIEQNKN